MESEAPNITQLLVAWGDGDAHALDALIPHVHNELHRLAVRYMSAERQRNVLQPTALVNEAFLKLVDWKNVRWNSRAHFFAVAAQIMRHTLVDAARASRRQKRGGGAVEVAISQMGDKAQLRSTDLVALDDALGQLEKLAPRQACVVELLFFGGLSQEEAAEALNISEATVRRDWRLAKSWLFRELKQS